MGAAYLCRRYPSVRILAAPNCLTLRNRRAYGIVCSVPHEDGQVMHLRGYVPTTQRSAGCAAPVDRVSRVQAYRASIFRSVTGGADG